MGTVPQKRLFVWGISRISYLSALGSQARTVLFSTNTSFLFRFDPFLGSLWILSHIGKKCAPRMPYKLLGKGMVYHYYMPYKLLGKGMVYHYYTCGSGTPCHCPRAYKAYVGRISCRCGTKVSSPEGENPDLPRRLKTKTLRAWLPKETISLQGLEQNPPLQLESNSTTMLELYR